MWVRTKAVGRMGNNMDMDERSGTATDDSSHTRPVTRKQCIGCGAIGDSDDSIDHEDYCPEVGNDLG